MCTAEHISTALLLSEEWQMKNSKSYRFDKNKDLNYWLFFIFNTLTEHASYDDWAIVLITAATHSQSSHYYLGQKQSQMEVVSS